MPGWGLSQRLPRTIGLYRAKELTLTGRALSGRQAEAWGLASRCVPDGELMQVARDMAKAMIAGSPGMLPPLKAVMNEGSRTTLGEALVLENRKARVINRALRPDQLQFKRTASDANSQP